MRPVASEGNKGAALKGSTAFKRNLALWGGCAFLWFVLDRVTKAVIDGRYSVGDVLASDIFGLVQINLVHNRGVAWGAFSGAVPAISVVTALMCAAIAAFAVYSAKQYGKPEAIALGLLFAGGIGNLFDRVVNGYVVDFITPLFIDFPTFNVADIGVTCGIALLFIALLVQMAKEVKACDAGDTGEKE